MTKMNLAGLFTAWLCELGFKQSGRILTSGVLREMI
jgi:hypothetical protein